MGNFDDVFPAHFGPDGPNGASDGFEMAIKTRPDKFFIDPYIISHSFFKYGGV